MNYNVTLGVGGCDGSDVVGSAVVFRNLRGAYSASRFEASGVQVPVHSDQR